jgi:hypothetical protein
MKVEILILTTASALTLALAYPTTAQIACASALVIATNHIERRRKQRKQQNALRREPER